MHSLLPVYLEEKKLPTTGSHCIMFCLTTGLESMESKHMDGNF
jgi:hypothetical protein